MEHIHFTNSGALRMTTTKSYDHLNRLTAIGSVNASAMVLDSHAYAYNDANQRVAMTNADNSRWSYGYDSLGQVTSGRKYWSDHVPVAGEQFEYGFDDIGNRVLAKDGGDQFGGNLRNVSYSANNLNQYTSRTVSSYVNIVGSATNTATVTVNNQPTYRHGDFYRAELQFDNTSSAVYPSLTNLAVLNQGTNADILTNVTGNVFLPQTPEVFHYDADGNLTNDGRWVYTWDAENRLIQMVSATGVGPQQLLKFDYDHQSRRIHKQVWNNTTATGNPVTDLKFLYDGWNLIAELNATNNAVIRSYLWGSDLSGSMQGAGGVGGLVAIWSPSASQFVNFDGNGNVSTLVDATTATGAIAARYEYDPFGEVIRATGPIAKVNPFRFLTKCCDDETDLLYYGYRYYNASTSRWLNRDPLEEYAGFNIYEFAVNDPISIIDLFGMGTWTIQEGEIDVNKPGIKENANPAGFTAVYKPDPGECPTPGVVVTYQIVSQSSIFGQSPHVDQGGDMYGHHPKNTPCPLPPQMKPVVPGGYEDSPQSDPGDWIFQFTAVATCRTACKDTILSTYYFEFDEKTRKIINRDPKNKKHFKKGMNNWWDGDKNPGQYYNGPVPF